MSELVIEGYRVKVEPQPEGGFVASVPELPGCSVQVGSKDEIEGEIREAIKVYLLELSTKKPRMAARSEHALPQKRDNKR